MVGEAKKRSRSRAKILAEEARCIYCDKNPTTIEHMPPIAMFRARRRLSGLEFASCEFCNVGTKAADIVAAFMSRFSVESDGNDWLTQEAYNFISGIDSLAPAVIHEIFASRRQERSFIRRRSGLIEPAHKLHLDGPVLTALMTVFAGKLGMALYREHVGAPLPLDGGVYTQFYFNAGLDHDAAGKMLAIMPVHETLIQGRSHANAQFAYRYNCDEKSILAALIGFHSCLHFRVFAMSDPERYRFLLGEYNVDLVRPGELDARVQSALAVPLPGLPRPTKSA